MSRKGLLPEELRLRVEKRCARGCERRRARGRGLREASREELQKGLCMLRLLKLGLRLRLLVDGLSLRLFFIYSLVILDL